MIRVVLDTNVIVSALVFGGLPREVLEMVEAGRCELFYSKPIQEEVRRVLAEKFRWHELILSEVLATVWQMGKLVLPSKTIKAVADDPDDNRILECALEAKAHAVVSGDHHLLDLANYRSIPILSPRQFISLYSKR